MAIIFIYLSAVQINDFHRFTVSRLFTSSRVYLEATLALAPI